MTTRPVGFVPLAALLLLGCPPPPGTPDATTPGDIAVARDLAAPADSAMPPADLAMPPADLATPSDMSGCAPATKVGASINVPCISRLFYEETGGFRPRPPMGSTCRGEESFQLTVDTALLEWTLCTIPMDFMKPWLKETGRRTLTAVEVRAIITALDPVVITAGAPCGADKPLMTITVTTPRGTQKYTDDFYSCNGMGPYVAKIDGAFQAVRAAAQP